MGILVGVINGDAAAAAAEEVDETNGSTNCGSPDFDDTAESNTTEVVREEVRDKGSGGAGVEGVSASYG